MNQIKVIASDLDGTLIPEGTQELEPGFMEVLKELLNRGIRFYTASGRPYAGMTHVFTEVHDRIGYICENGALVKEQEETTFLQKLPEDQAKAICNTIIEDPRTELFASAADCGYLTSKNQEFLDMMNRIVKNGLALADGYEDMGKPIIKIAMYVYDFEKNAADVKDMLAGLYGEDYDFAFSGNGWLDVIPKNAGKGVALRDVMERTGVSPEEIMVFGDNENDISMLKLTPYSFAKSNANAHVKANAGYECESVVTVLKNFLTYGEIDNYKIR